MNANSTHSSSHYSPHTYFQKSLSLFENGQIKAALQSLDAAIVFSNNSPFYIHQKIRILYSLGAVKNCSQLIAAQLEYLYKYGSSYIFCRTLDYFQKINHYTTEQLETILHASHVPYCFAIHYKKWLVTKNKQLGILAQRAYLQNDYELCIGYCMLYLKEHPQTEEYMNMLAHCYHMQGNLNAAKSMYLEYASVTTHKKKAALELALIYIDCGEYDEAVDYLNKLLESEPDNKMYLSYLGECYCLANKMNACIQTYETIAKSEPNDIQNLFNLSYAYQKHNKKWRSKRCLKQSEKLLKHTTSR